MILFQCCSRKDSGPLLTEVLISKGLTPPVGMLVL